MAVCELSLWESGTRPDFRQLAFSDNTCTPCHNPQGGHVVPNTTPHTILEMRELKQQGSLSDLVKATVIISAMVIVSLCLLLELKPFKMCPFLNDRLWLSRGS